MQLRTHHHLKRVRNNSMEIAKFILSSAWRIPLTALLLLFASAALLVADVFKSIAGFTLWLCDQVMADVADRVEIVEE